MTRPLLVLAALLSLTASTVACKNTAPSSFTTGTGGGAFSVTLSAAALSVPAGGTGSLTATVSLTAGSTDSIDLTSSATLCAVSPATLSATVTTATVTCSGLTPGTTTVTISGLDQTTGQSASAQFTLTID